MPGVDADAYIKMALGHTTKLFLRVIILLGCYFFLASLKTFLISKNRTKLLIHSLSRFFKNYLKIRAPLDAVFHADFNGARILR